MYPKRYTRVKVCDFARFVYKVTIFRHKRLFVQRCPRITLYKLEYFSQQYTPAFLQSPLHFIHSIANHTLRPAYPANTPHTHARIPFKRTHCPYTPRSRVHPHIALDNHTRAVSVNVTPVLQSTHTLCEICDNLFRVSHTILNKIKHLRECERWYVSCNVKRHERDTQTKRRRQCNT